MQVVFRQKYPWAILPYKERVNRKQADADAKMYAENFRWLRQERAPERCWPWRLAQEFGWIIPSPIDVRMEPVLDSELEVRDQERLGFSQATGLTDFWAPIEHHNYLVCKGSAWAAICEADFGGKHDQMFCPIGRGGLEWRLGWEMRFPDNYFAMVLPLPDAEGPEVLTGLLGHRAIAKFNEGYGMTIAVRPNAVTQVRRRQPLARIALISVESVKAGAVYETLNDVTEEAESEVP